MTNKPPKAIIVQMEPVTVSIKQAAQLLSVGENTLRMWVDRKTIPSIKVGGRIVISVDVIYAVEKDGYAELMNRHCDSRRQLKEARRGLREQGFRVYANG